MSDLEVLSTVINRLDNISVPVQLTEQISLPLINANNLLKQLYAAILEQIPKKDAKQEAASDEEEIQIDGIEATNELPEGAEEIKME